MEDNQVSECAWISELNRPLLFENGIFAKDQPHFSGIIFPKGNLSLRIIYIQLLISLNEFTITLLPNILLYYQFSFQLQQENRSNSDINIVPLNYFYHQET